MSSIQQNWRRGLNRFFLDARGMGEKEGAWSRGERWLK
jgi:hypothetical protein